MNPISAILYVLAFFGALVCLTVGLIEVLARLGVKGVDKE